MKIDIRKATKLIRDKLGNLLKINPNGSINVNILKSIKCQILCAEDLEKSFTWQKIDGVYRVTQIVFESDTVNTELGQTAVLERDFTYESSDPYNLVSVNDSLSIT